MLNREFCKLLAHEVTFPVPCRRRSLQRPMVTVSRPLELGGGAAPPPTVSVLTYNVLAQSLIEKNT